MQPPCDNAMEPCPVVTVTFDEQLTTAVADSTAGEQSACPSFAGDSKADSSNADSDESEAAREERRKQRFAPVAPQQGDPNARRESSIWNDEREVGNFGLMVGNLGLRGTVGSKSSQKARRDTQDRQIQKSPAQVIVLAEAAPEIEDLLR